MALQFPMYHELHGTEPDYAQALMKGMKVGYEPARQSQELLGHMLEAKINKIKGDYTERLMQSQIAHNQALTERAKRGPVPVLSNLEKAIQGYRRIVSEYGEGSEQANYAKSYLNKISQGAQGADKFPANDKIAQLQWFRAHPKEVPEVENEDSHVPSIGFNSDNIYQPTKKPDLNKMIMDEFNNSLSNKGKSYAPSNTVKDIEALQDAKDGYVPGTSRTKPFENPGDQKNWVTSLENANKQKDEIADAMNSKRRRQALGLKQGEDYINQKGEVTTDLNEAIAKRRPFSERERKEQSGRKAFNVTYPFILKATSYYSGKGSIKKFNRDIANYDSDKNAQKRIQNYITASQLISQGIIKEDATLGGANTNQVYNKLAKSLNASDLPIKFEQLEIQFRLPSSAKLHAGLEFNTYLNKSLKAGENIPATTTEYLNGKKEGHIYNEKTKEIERVMVPSDEWDAFLESGGY